MKYIFLYILLLSAGFGLRLFIGELSGEDTFMQLMWIANYVLVFTMVGRRKSFWKAVVSPKMIPILVLFLYLLLSSAWSIDASKTFRRSTALILSYLAAIALVYTMDRQKVYWVFKRFFQIVLLSIPIIILVDPNLVLTSRMQHDGAWAGPFNHHNTLGRIAALSCVFWMLNHEIAKSKLLNFVLIGSSLFLIFMSQSEGAILFFFLALAVLLMIHLKRVSKVLNYLYLYLVGSAGIVILFSYKLVLGLFNKSADLTGRVYLWEKAITDVSHNPILGFGYNVYWEYYTSSFNSLSPEITLGWDAPHSHNGYIELLLAGGIVGLLLYGIVLYGLAKSIALFKTTDLNRHYTFALILVVFILFTGLFINSPFVRNDINLFLFLYAYGVLRSFRGTRNLSIAELPTKKTLKTLNQ